MKKTKFFSTFISLLTVCMVAFVSFGVLFSEKESITLTANASSFTMRTTAPSTGDAVYYANNPFYQSGYGLPNCTCYAYGRAWEILGSKPELPTGNAGSWYWTNISTGKYAYGSTPKLGAIACWDKYDKNQGHVAVVENIDGNNVTLSESHYKGTLFDNKVMKADGSNYLTSYRFLGYIYIGDFTKDETLPCICTPAYAGTYTTCNVSSNLNIHAENTHSLSESVVGQIPAGAKFDVIKGDGTTAHVNYNGCIGVVSMSYIQRTVPDSGIERILFDAAFYYARYEDLQEAYELDEAALYNHWIQYGIPEGRTASMYFDLQYYLNAHDDLKAAFGTDYQMAYDHYLNYGKDEVDRKLSPIYDGAYYQSNYSDLAAYDAYGLLVHFKDYGVNEGRRASAEFDPAFYRNEFQDTANSYGDSWHYYYWHYMIWGISEGRSGNSHTYVTTVTAPTCTAKGYTLHTCKYCGNSYKDTETAAAGHSYTSKVTKAATCTAEGVKTYTCSVCKDSYTEAIAKTAHTYASEWTTDEKATCAQEGSKSHHCTVCGAKGSVTAIPKTDTHSFGEWKVVTAPTATSEGTASRKCTVCGKEETKQLDMLTSTVPGDINQDGECNVLDVVMLQKWLLGAGDLTNWQNADLYEDGVIDIFDLAMMKRKLIYG